MSMQTGSVSTLCPTCVYLVSHFECGKNVCFQGRVPVSTFSGVHPRAHTRARAGKHVSRVDKWDTNKQERVSMSVEKIIRELPPEFVTRMRNWARSHAGGAMYARSRIFDDVQIRSGYDETIVPILRGEAEDVDNAMAVLPGQLRQAVSLFWQYDNPPLAWLGRRMNPHGKALDWRTVQARIERGHERLIAVLRQQKAEIHQYRDNASLHGAAC